jgi:hypothetical protein
MDKGTVNAIKVIIKGKNLLQPVMVLRNKYFPSVSFILLMFNFAVMILACKQSNKKVEMDVETKIDSVGINQYILNLSDSEKYTLERLIILNGDTNAYDKLRFYHARNAKMDYFLYFSIIMAHKYHYPQAYLDAEISLRNPWMCSEFDSLDNRTKALVGYFHKCYIEATGSDEFTSYKIFKNDSFLKSSDILNYTQVE